MPDWTAMDVNEFVDGYLTCALWSSFDYDEMPLDDRFAVADIAPESLYNMTADCMAFMVAQEVDLTWYCLAVEPREWTPLGMAGHDLWLTRNGHGTGYWDRGAGAAGELLTHAAKELGESVLYVGDDGRLYV